MNLIKTLFHRQPKAAQPLRSVVAYRTESLAVTLRKQQRRAQLQRYVDTTTPEQRKAETDLFFARAREPGFEKAARLGGWAGMRTPKLGKGSAV